MADERDDEAFVEIAGALAGVPSAAFKARLRRSLERSTTVTDVTTRSIRGARPGFTAVTPYVMTRDIEPVIAFAKQVFDARETLRTTGAAGGTHCELRLGDSMLMFGGGGASNPAPRLIGFHVHVPDVDAAYGRALNAGATSMGEPADRPYGERAGFVKDPAGNHWYIATRLGPRDPAHAPAEVTPHLYVHRTAERGAPELLAFMQAAFGARVEARHDAPDGLVMHAVIRVQGAAIEIGEGREPAFPAPAAFYLYVADCDAVYAQANAAGARSLFPPVDQPFGDRMGAVADPFGNEWFVATHLG